MLFGSVFMLNISLFSAWVKNVYSLCVEGVTKCVNLYTGVGTQTTQAHKVVVQPSTFTQVMDTFPPTLYTPKFSFLPLVITDLYTVSTVPTIKKMK